MPDLERRNFNLLEVRAKSDTESGTLVGYAAVFEELSHPFDDDMLGSQWFEEILPGAFSRSLRESEHDIMACWSHDISMPLASRQSGSLSLTEDEKGLAFEMTPVKEISWAQDALAAVRGGLIRKMSIGFKVRGEEWKKKVDNKTVRSLTDIDLYEVSPVSLAAYEGTEVEARAALSSYKKFMATDERALAVADQTKAVARFKFARARNARRSQ